MESPCDNVLDLAINEDVLSEEDMDYTQPQYSRREVNDAGVVLTRFMRDSIGEPREINHATDVVINFRAAHAFPLNTIITGLRGRANTLDGESIIAQRLKRLSSIWVKLDIFKTMKLWDMQDIGGCRAVVNSLDGVKRIVEAYKSSRIRHKPAGEKDYIKEPKDTGYRSMHLIYRYISDRNEIYNGLKVEIQIRTPLQHAWATTVETVDAFTQQALKSSRGKPEWERFFQLMGTQMALIEGTPPVPETPTDRRELRQELIECEKSLKVISSLAGFATALRITTRPTAKDLSTDYYLLSLDNISERLNITGYKRGKLMQASKAYARKESQIRNQKGKDAVLVSVGSIRNLQRAYPNYFADTSMFVEELKKALQ